MVLNKKVSGQLFVKSKEGQTPIILMSTLLVSYISRNRSGHVKNYVL